MVLSGYIPELKFHKNKYYINLKIINIKNNLIILLIAVFTFSCETAPKEVELGPAPGYLATADGKIDARDADPANLGIWEKYIDAHNNRDYETIASMNHDSIVLNLADGTDVIGNDNHMQTLKAYMDASNPKWDIFFSYTMNVEGQNGDWVIAGHNVTETVDGEESNPWIIADAFIVDGKIRRIIGYRKDNK